MSILEFDKVTFLYEGNKRKILDKVSYKFEQGTFYTVVGPSGSGKTTTLSLAGALDEPISGSVLFEGNDIKEIGYSKYRQKDVALVFQSYNLIKYMNAIENVVAALDISKSKVKNKKEEALRILKKLGLTEEECKRDIRQLSGGQQQRVAIARAVAGNAPVILADEPTGNLDKKTGVEIIDIFKSLAKDSGKCVIVVTHSSDVSKKSDIVLNIEDGELKEVCNN